MSTWDRIRALLRREQRDVAEAVEEFKSRADAALDQRERDLRATPEERIAIEQERAAANDESFEAIRRRIEGDGR